MVCSSILAIGIRSLEVVPNQNLTFIPTVAQEYSAKSVSDATRARRASNNDGRTSA